MLLDKGFRLGTVRMKKAMEAAEKLKQWIPSNASAVSFFESVMVKHLEKCTKEGMSHQEGRELAVTKFHRLRCSEAFANLWKAFLTPVDQEMATDPIFYQHISRSFFNNFIKFNFPIPAPSNDDTRPAALTFEESNALRYVAGYVCAELYKRLKSSTTSNKEDLLLGIDDMIDSEHVDMNQPSASWLNLIDRGGLVHVHEKVHTLFTRMEMLAREILRRDKVDQLPHNISITRDGGVLSAWDDIGIELQRDDKQ